MSEIDEQSQEKKGVFSTSLSVQEKEVALAIPTNTLYNTIAQTLQALSQVTVAGDTPGGTLSPHLQAHTTKRFIPDTEIEMLHSKALPMSDTDIKTFKEAKQRRHSLQTRREELRTPYKTLAELTGPRVRVAYRLARYMTHIRGIGAIGEPLIFTMASNNSQINLLELPMPYNPAAGWYRGLAPVRNLLQEISEMGFTYTYKFTESAPADAQVYSTRGMSILPPPIHDGYFPPDRPAWHYRQIEYTPEYYNPEADGPLNSYLNMMEFIVRHLGIGETCLGQSLDDEAAASALLNPKIARLAWPCRDDLETYEEYVLLPYVNRITIEKSPVKAVEELKKELGLTHAEAFDIVETAKTYAQQAYVFDPSREKALMVNKLHNLAEDCSEAGMVTTQLNSFKTILQVLGLTKHEEDTNVDKREVLSSALEGEIVKSSHALPAGEDQ